MRLSSIKIRNFRNFSDFEVQLGRSAVILGENQIGKTNLIHALRLVMDPSLPDSARQLRHEDFWDGAKPLDEESHIQICVEISDFEDDEDELAILAEHLVEPTPMVARLTYEFGPIPDLGREPCNEEDFEFVTYGGDRPENRFGYELRKRMPIEVMSALRDAEGDLARWSRSPLKPLLDQMKSELEPRELDDIADAVTSATDRISELEPIQELRIKINRTLKRMAGANHATEMDLGFSATDPNKLLRSLRLLFDDKKRDISEASLGTANVLYLALRSLDLEAMVDAGNREHTFFSIEEPEAHLHPHLQRLVYKSYLRPRSPENVSARDDEEGGGKIVKRVSYLMTTHSAEIASVTPVESLIFLRKNAEGTSTIGVSGSSIPLSVRERDDIERYLDVSRAEGLFARGILLVEGDAEKFLVPLLAARAGYDLDALGVTVCSVAGTNFVPYVKFFGPHGLNIPMAVITDGDPYGDEDSYGDERAVNQILPALLGEEETPTDFDECLGILGENGIFLNEYTFEVDLFEAGYCWSISNTMRDLCTVKAAVNRARKRAETKEMTDEEVFLKDVGYVGKGRFAQRLASYIAHSKVRSCPKYILEAIRYVVE
ncbi:AAA family ATPase [Coraliomargarita algicola]|uniref:AAA family ATPase n=1 Tax=Coraliomargarita algicola TaxID=3092156 RepID=A0ABZ0RGI0_9BACT|nr:AAA family ATPase [Coraliomargarita sp. J2-16]WPJ95132.1 AAA family ATPase [Coraliomargarita sp. J2-16]